jgi:hypothetical protein
MPLGRCRPRWQDNIRMDLKSGGTEWTGSGSGWGQVAAFVNVGMNSQFP